MTAIVNNINGANTYALQNALSAYSDEAYTNARKLSGTGIVGPNPNITTDTETFIGQVRWFKPINPTINVASLTNAANGTGTTYDSDFASYIKTVRTHGATQVNLQRVISQVDGLAKIGKDFGETKSQDEHNAILSLLKGVAVSEVLNGAGTGSGATGLGGQTFSNDPTDMKYGFYVDLGSAKPVVAASVTQQGAQRAEGFLNALGMAWKDYEPEYAYLVVSPEVLASLRSANLVDETKVTEGNIMFDTIFGGKFRLIQTRANQSLSTAELAMLNTGAGVDVAGVKTSFIVLPGAIAMEPLVLPEPVGIQRNEDAYNGGGSTSIWYRWGYVAHPGGYDWNGATTKFPSDAEYQYVVDTAVSGAGSAVAANTPQALASFLNTAGAAAIQTTTKGTWKRKTQSALALGILPIFHA